MVGDYGVTYDKNNPQGQFKQEAAKELNTKDNQVTSMKKDALTKTDQNSALPTQNKKDNDTFFSG